jgi:hypothetical protein
LTLPTRRPEPHSCLEGEGQSGASKCGEWDGSRAEKQTIDDERAHHYY